MKKIKFKIDDFVFLIGLSLLCGGLFLIYKPAALIIPGMILMITGLRR